MNVTSTISKRPHLLAMIFALTGASLILLDGEDMDISAGQLRPALSEDLVFVTEDLAQFVDGCDAVSIMDLNSLTAVRRGVTKPSPGRLGALPDMSVVLGNVSNVNSLGLFIYGWRREGDSWQSFAITGANFAPVGAVAGLSDGDSILVGVTGEALGREYPSEPYELKRYRLSDLDPWPPVGVDGPSPRDLVLRLGPPTGSLDIEGVPVRIFPTSDGHSAHIVTDKGEILTIDLRSMTESAARISVGKVDESIGNLHELFLSKSHAAISRSGRYIVLNRWDENEVRVADLLERKSWTLSVPFNATGRIGVGGVAFDHMTSDGEVLALHGIDEVAVLEFDPNRLELIAKRSVKPPYTTGCSWRTTAGCGGPHASIAWSGTGGQVIAASDNRAAEFVVLDYDTESSSLLEQGWLTACPWHHEDRFFENIPNDILSSNGLLANPIPTPTDAAPSPTLTLTEVVPTVTATGTQTPISSATATVTVTATANASATPTETETPEASATLAPSATPVPSATKAVHFTYLPNVSLTRCKPSRRPNDVVLILDTSTSMRGGTSDGGARKIDAAKEAAKLFIAQLQFSVDRGAIVSFNDSANVHSWLSNDSGKLVAAIDAVSIAPGTRIDAGLDLARVVLNGPGHREAGRPVIVMLTDGQPTSSTASRVLLAAEDVKREGVTLFAIGLGSDIDALLLELIASTPGHYFAAPDASDLSRVYTAIAEVIPCN